MSMQMATYCNFCGAEVPDGTDCRNDCPSCHAKHRAEMEAGLIPRGLPKKAYKFWLWRNIRQLERDVIAGRETEAEARRKVTRMVNSARESYESELLREAERQRAVEAEERERYGPTGFLL